MRVRLLLPVAVVSALLVYAGCQPVPHQDPPGSSAITSAVDAKVAELFPGATLWTATPEQRLQAGQAVFPAVPLESTELFDDGDPTTPLEIRLIFKAPAKGIAEVAGKTALAHLKDFTPPSLAFALIVGGAAAFNAALGYMGLKKQNVGPNGEPVPTKPILLSKTILASGLVGAAGMLNETKGFVDSTTAANWIVTISGALQAALRVITDRPVGGILPAKPTNGGPQP